MRLRCFSSGGLLRRRHLGAGKPPYFATVLSTLCYRYEATIDSVATTFQSVICQS
jgi:hypothetical protein